MAVDATTTVRHNQVDKNGRIEIAGPTSIAIGSVPTGVIATVIRTGNYTYKFIKITLIRELTIDSTKKSQPLYRRGGKPWKNLYGKTRDSTELVCSSLSPGLRRIKGARADWPKVYA
jgi:hypothetical protein